MTSSSHSLNNLKKYTGNLQIHTADGIHNYYHIYYDILASVKKCFFVSPAVLTTNLIFVGQLIDIDYKVEFSKFGCIVKDQ